MNKNEKLDLRVSRWWKWFNKNNKSLIVYVNHVLLGFYFREYYY